MLLRLGIVNSHNKIIFLVSEESKLFGVCKVSVAGILTQPDKRSALLSQALFGEYVVVIKRKSKHWFKVKCVWDETIGWINPLQFYFSEDINEEDATTCNAFSLEMMHGLYSNSMTLPITIGSNLQNCDGINLRMPFGKYQYTGQIVNLEQAINNKSILCKIALRYLHAPFMNGGRTALGIDSSGLIQMAFKMIGTTLPRTCLEQSELGTDIGFVAYSQVGDLAFFANGKNEISHVGFIVEPNKIIHVHGRVKIDQLDNQGIYDLETKKYSYKLRTIRRVLNDDQIS